MRCQNAEQQLIFIMFRSNWIHKIAIDPATFQEKCLVAVNCLSQRSRRITRGAVANQRMLHPALLTFMWEVVKGKRGRKKKRGRHGRRGTNRREGSGGKIRVRMKAKLGHPQLQKNNFRLIKCGLIKDRAATQCGHGTKHLALKLRSPSLRLAETDLSPVCSWGTEGSAAVCLQSGAESEGPAL